VEAARVVVQYDSPQHTGAVRVGSACRLLLNPLLGDLTFVFTVIFDSNNGRHLFILFLAIGLFPLNFFASGISQATESIISASRIVGAVYFPENFLLSLPSS
jgi:ABC-type polysaccharide/polyol phosphate export permease